MSNTVIKIENVSKQYRIGQVGTGSISHDLHRFWYKMRGKEDPFLKVGEVNDRTQKAAGDYVWALQQISADIKRGEIVGVIGNNGAGKSTLLKIISRTTTPTRGSISIRGRIASLLEVGTGFHPELTGKENIYLNGSILGMSRTEIKSKFDEIVSFAGVEKYIDTPVKRYSSGMYVRLGFAVAAHLEPEILIVDEVLAVGDYEFQQKCLGKMKDVSTNDGRTILFVSHNLRALQNLCQRGIVLSNGLLAFDGPADAAIEHYLGDQSLVHERHAGDSPMGNEYIHIMYASVEGGGNTGVMYVEENTTISFEFKILKPLSGRIAVLLRSKTGDVIFESGTELIDFDTGKYRVDFTVPANFLNTVPYKVQVNLTNELPAVLFYQVDVLSFKPEQKESAYEFYHYPSEGLVQTKLPYQLKPLD